jgi:hypothetical protein
MYFKIAMKVNFEHSHHRKNKWGDRYITAWCSPSALCMYVKIAHCIPQICTYWICYCILLFTVIFPINILKKEMLKEVYETKRKWHYMEN